MLTSAVVLASAAQAALPTDEVRPLAAAVETIRTASGVQCRVLSSSGVPDRDEAACNVVKPKAEAAPRREVVGFWHIDGRPADFQRAKPLGRFGAALTSDDLSNPTHRAIHISTRYVVNEQGRVERCAGAVASDDQAIVARACAIMTKRFRFVPAMLNGRPVKDTYQQSFMIPRER